MPATVPSHDSDVVSVPTYAEFVALMVRVATLEAHVQPDPLPAAVPVVQTGEATEDPAA